MAKQIDKKMVVHVPLKRTLIDEIDKLAEKDDRSRPAMIAILLKHALAEQKGVAA